MSEHSGGGVSSSKYTDGGDSVFFLLNGEGGAGEMWVIWFGWRELVSQRAAC
jgi:hypothetical protein